MIETFTVLGGAIALWSAAANRDIKPTVLWLFLSSLIFFYGLRWEMGTDWTTHYRYFFAVDNYGPFRLPGVEPGFGLYLWLMRRLTNTYSIFLLVTTALAFIGILYAVYKMTGSFVALFYLTGTIPWYAGSQRQMLACVCFTLAMKASMETKLTQFIALMIAATMFHTTAILFVPMYWLYGLSSATYVVIFVALAIASALSRSLLPVLDVVVGYYGLGRSFAARAGGIPEASNPLLGFPRKFFTIAGLVAFSHAAESSPRMETGQRKEIRFTLMLASLSIIFYYMGTYQINYVSSRVDIYSGLIATAVLIGLLDRTFRSRMNRILLFVFVAALVGIFYSRLVFMDLFHPYSSIFYNYELHRVLY